VTTRFSYSDSRVTSTVVTYYAACCYRPPNPYNESKLCIDALLNGIEQCTVLMFLELIILVNIWYYLFG